MMRVLHSDLARARARVSLRWLQVAFWALAIVLGAVHAWVAATNYSMNPDGIAYLDIGDAYLRGDWQAAINPVWSPFYSWILGLVMRIVNPPMRWEFPLVHLVNFAIYLGALVCFEFFWRQVLHSRQEGHVTLPTWAWWALGYALFIWSSLSLIQIWAVTPDMLMAAWVYLAAGLILRIRMGAVAWRMFVMLGAVLGLGYLAKTIMFPLAFVFVAISLFAVGNIRRAIPLAGAALIAFALVGGPFVGAISSAKGRLTFGEVGMITYVRYVNGVPYPHWQGETPGHGSPIHPSRQISDAPPIYEFGSPVSGTYPISYDPSYWYEGVRPRFDLAQQARALLSNALFYFDLFFRQQGALVIGVLLLYLARHWKRPRPVEVLRQWALVIPALAALGLYALVYVEGRYIGVFVVLLWAELLTNVYLPASLPSRRMVSWLSAIMIAFVLLNLAAFNLAGLNTLSRRGQEDTPSSQVALAPSWPGEVAETLHGLGVQPGDKVAVIGYAFDSYWARLARVQIVAELLGWDADAFWLGDPATQARAITAFASTGARAIVAEYVPAHTSPAGWHRVSNSSYYIYLLAPAGPPG